MPLATFQLSIKWRGQQLWLQKQIETGFKIVNTRQCIGRRNQNGNKCQVCNMSALEFVLPQYLHLSITLSFVRGVHNTSILMLNKTVNVLQDQDIWSTRNAAENCQQNLISIVDVNSVKQASNLLNTTNSNASSNRHCCESYSYMYTLENLRCLLRARFTAIQIYCYSNISILSNAQRLWDANNVHSKHRTVHCQNTGITSDAVPYTHAHLK